MSVIAKLMIRGVTDFGMGRLIELSCVCENDLMAAYATSEEDRLFSKYSPSGDMKMSQPAGWTLGEEPDEFTPPRAFYVMALHESEYAHKAPDLSPDRDRYQKDRNFPTASAWAFGFCYSMTSFGADTRRVEFRANSGGSIQGRAIEKLNWKMSVDNPAASGQFKPGERYWFALYDAARFDRDAAIRAAHGHPAPEPLIGGPTPTEALARGSE